jgi:hypothetical protein
MFTRSKQKANEAQLQFRRENPITLCGRIAHTACHIYLCQATNQNAGKTIIHC